ncbi:MAG: hypothetical protein ABIH92_04090, partial [Nanoarchaeota archaeon]
IDPLSQGNLGGIFINQEHWALYLPPDGEYWAPAAYLLDTSPTTSGVYDEDWYNVALLPNETFFDEGSGIKIKNIEEDTSDPNDPRIIFSVEFFTPECVRVEPKLTFFQSWPIEANPGERVDILNHLLALSVKNLDSIICANGTFEFAVDVPIGWQYNFEPLQMILPPGGSGSLNIFEIIIPVNASEGEYPIFINVTNLDSGLSTHSNFTVNASVICDLGWLYSEEIEKCVYNGWGQGMNFTEAVDFCESNGGWLPFDYELEDICDEFVLRPGESCNGYQCMGSVRIADERLDDHKLWHDKGFHFESSECGEAVYEFCGTNVRGPDCAWTEAWIPDSSEEYGIVCLKEPS